MSTKIVRDGCGEGEFEVPSDSGFHTVRCKELAGQPDRLTNKRSKSGQSCPWRDITVYHAGSGLVDARHEDQAANAIYSE